MTDTECIGMVRLRGIGGNVPTESQVENARESSDSSMHEGE